MVYIGVLCFGAFLFSYVASRFLQTERVPPIPLGIGLGLPTLLYSSVWRHVFFEDALASLGVFFSMMLAAVGAIIGGAIVFFARER